MNKMDDYYKKQLSDFTPAEDGWNIPSEKMWNKAQPHFPKPKKKRRFIFIFLTLGMLLLISTYFLITPSSSEPSMVDVVSNTKTPTNQEKQNVTSQNTTSTTSHEIIKQNATIINTSSVKEAVNSKSISVQPSQSALSNDKISLAKKIVTQKDLNSNLENNTIETTLKTVAVSKSYKESISDYNTKQIQTSKSNGKNINSNSRNINNKQLSASREIHSLATLSAVQSKPLRNHQQSFLFNIPTKPQIPSVVKNVPFAKYELGIGSTLHLLILIGTVKNGENEKWPEEEIYFESYGNKNLNLHYQNYLSENWFLSTGVYYDRLNLNIYGDTYNEFTEESINGNISTNLDRSFNEGFASNRQNEEYLMELIPGETVSAGDTLKVGLDLDLSLDILQLPLLVNRKWNIKRTEIFIGLGGSVGHQTYRLQSASIQLFRDNRLISQPYQEGPGEVERLLTFDFIFQTGINYNITNKLKFGLAGKVFIPQLFPTGIEARFLYRI